MVEAASAELTVVMSFQVPQCCDLKFRIKKTSFLAALTNYSPICFVKENQIST